MQINFFKDLKKFTLTSTVTKENIDLVKKHRPAALKIKDKDGNDIFGMSYVEGKSCVSANGITFGATSSEGGYAMIVGDIPADVAKDKVGEYIADLVGAALAHINTLEQSVPAAAAEITAERSALIGTIAEV